MSKSLYYMTENNNPIHEHIELGDGVRAYWH